MFVRIPRRRSSLSTMGIEWISPSARTSIARSTFFSDSPRPVITKCMWMRVKTFGSLSAAPASVSRRLVSARLVVQALEVPVIRDLAG